MLKTVTVEVWNSSPPRSERRVSHRDRARDGGGRQKKKHTTGSAALSLLSEMFFSPYKDVTKKTVRETVEQKAEVVGPHHGAVMVLWSPPGGVHTCKGRNWADVFSLQVASGSPCWPVTGLCRDSSPSGWVSAQLITDHQAQWTINLNQTAPQYLLWHLLHREILIALFHEQACAKNRVERFQCLRWLSPVPQASGKMDGRWADWTSFNTGGGGIARAVQVRNMT